MQCSWLLNLRPIQRACTRCTCHYSLGWHHGCMTQRLDLVPHPPTKCWEVADSEHLYSVCQFFLLPVWKEYGETAIISKKSRVLSDRIFIKFWHMIWQAMRLRFFWSVFNLIYFMLCSNHLSGNLSNIISDIKFYLAEVLWHSIWYGIFYSLLLINILIDIWSVILFDMLADIFRTLHCVWFSLFIILTSHSANSIWYDYWQIFCRSDNTLFYIFALTLLSGFSSIAYCILFNWQDSSIIIRIWAKSYFHKLSKNNYCLILWFL